MSSHASSPPHIDESEQKQPNDINEVPIPGSENQPQMLLGRELPGEGSPKANRQKDGADDDMGAVESRGHEEDPAIDIATIVKWCG